MKGSRNSQALRASSVRLIDTDVASPDNSRAGGTDRIHQPCRLRVVKEDDVPWMDQRLEGTDAGFEAGHIGGSFLIAEITAIPTGFVEVVVNALGHTK